MADINRRMLDDMCQAGLVRSGHFGFGSGQHSSVALDRDRLLSEPGFASHLGYVIAKYFFTSVVDTVAAPSMWGAALAQWVGYFLQPRATIVFTQKDGDDFHIPDSLLTAIRGRRVLLVDNLIVTGDTMRRFTRRIAAEDGEIIGAGTLWTLAEVDVPGRGVFGLFNTQYPVYPADRCPLCEAGIPVETNPYTTPHS